ncbi:hypothetical protein [Ensifer sp. BR816]|uniref:hypothetical protein n=1 Tax=Rhizobium sp. (strain BR816) TaxID=1057002 RepID=UPI0003767F72|nr:hypothetical protein [Ensifer sp. BR816]
MNDNQNTTRAEFLSNDIVVLLRDPLLGIIELKSFANETIEFLLDRYSAAALLSALAQFLAQGDGDDAPNVGYSMSQ